MTIRNIGFIARGAFAAALALLMLTPPALCAEPAAPAAVVFPVGSRVGLVPPPGMVASKTFPGFMDPEKNAGIVIRVMPPNAYPAMKESLTDDTLKKQGLTVVNRDTMQLAIGKADLVVGNELSPDKKPFRKWLLLVSTNDLTAAVSVQAPADDSVYSDAAVRTALASLTLRAKVPDTDYLQVLPFKVGDTAGFHIGNVIPGRALMLIDAPDYPHMIATNGLPEYEFNARFIVTAAPGGPSDPNQRANLAHDAFNSIDGIKDKQVTMAEPVRINGQEAFETVASAKDVSTGANLMVVQWLRFGGGAFLQMIGVSRAEIWDKELPRLRAIRDGIAFK
ncbi:MAG: hypothetical protein WA268_16430 [Xanthobacteraceae bacterium]